MIVWVEMWCDELSVPPGSSLTLHCEYGGEQHPPTIEPIEGGIAFWPEADTYTAELDGQPLSV
jgi:hypothetical protein